MSDFLIEHAGFVVIASFVLYALAIYKLVDSLKQLTENIEKLKPFRVVMAAVIGGLTGPFTFPSLFRLLGVETNVTVAFSVILGIGAGAVAVNIHNYIDRKLS